MAIGNTKYHNLLRKHLLISEAAAWFNFFSTENKETIIKLVRDRLFETGEDKHGGIIGLYSFATEWITKGEKKEGDPYNLKDSGDFYQLMFVSVFNDLFEINDGQGADKMKDKEWWSEDIVGLNEEQKQEILEMLKKHYLDYAKKILLGVK
jgi:hypothetical protein